MSYNLTDIRAKYIVGTENLNCNPTIKRRTYDQFTVLRSEFVRPLQIFFNLNLLIAKLICTLNAVSKMCKYSLLL